MSTLDSRATEISTYLREQARSGEVERSARSLMAEAGRVIDELLDSRGESFDHGYAEGYRQGWDEGYGEGYDEGYEEGHDQGLADAEGERVWA